MDNRPKVGVGVIVIKDNKILLCDKSENLKSAVPG